MGDGTDEATTLCVDTIMRRWPSTIRVFLRYRMHCVGCAVARFHTISEACAAHGTDEPGLRSALAEAIAAGPDDPAPEAAP